ncbi:MAG: GIY-YIG nuclease family protein [Candidatus Ratteibacteria bacterium]|jgi:putative endonuclease
MHYVYILHSLKDNQFYTGYTEDIQRRFKEHNSGQEKSTKYRLPFVLVYFEAYADKRDALGREEFLKSGSGKRYLKKQLKNYLAENGGSDLTQ